MNLRKLGIIITVIFAFLGIGFAALAAATDTTGTNVACATNPDNTVAVNGTNVHTITGVTHCETQTYTIPTVTQPAVTQTVTETVTGAPPTSSTSSSSSSSTTTTSTTSTAPPPTPTCDKYGSPTGSDTASGTLNAPYQTVEKVANSLSSGQTGCLKDGSYGGLSVHTDIKTSGITLTAVPGSSPTVQGFFSLDGNNDTLEHLHINGANTFYVGPNVCGMSNVSEALEVNGTGNILQYDDLTQSERRGNMIGVGFFGVGQGANTIIRYNKIHDVGACHAFDHPIYVSHGDGTQIYDNWIWNDANGFGVQLYPCPNNVSVHSNVLDKVATGFVVLAGSSCNVTNNTITHNVVANSVGNSYMGSIGVGVQTCCGGPGPGSTGNTFNVNDVFNNPGGVGSGGPGLTLSNNITSDPLFVDAAAHNYALQPGSPVAGYGLWDGSGAP